MKLDKILEEEVKRFNQIGTYVGSLSELAISGVGTGSGFVNPQGGSVLEQGDPEADEPAEDDFGLDIDAGEEIEGEIEDTGEEIEDAGEEIEGEIEDTGEEIEGDTKEVDVTDIVKMAKGAEDKAGEAKETLDAQTDKIDSLVSKLDNLEIKLDSIDKIVDKIDNLETEIIDAMPPTPVEQLELRSLDSGPFTQKPLEFWQEKQDEISNRKGKHEYVLTKDEVEDYSTQEIQKSFTDPTDEQEEEDERREKEKRRKEDEVLVLGNKPNK